MRATPVSRFPSIGPTPMPGGRTERPEATRLAEIGGVPSVGQPGERRHRTPESLNAFSEAELVFGPGRGALRDVSHHEAVTMSSFTWWRRPGYRALSETLSRRPEPTTSSGPTRQKTAPKARKESTVRSLQGSRGEPPGTAPSRPAPMPTSARPATTLSPGNVVPGELCPRARVRTGSRLRARRHPPAPRRC